MTLAAGTRLGSYEKGVVHRDDRGLAAVVDVSADGRSWAVCARSYSRLFLVEGAK